MKQLKINHVAVWVCIILVHILGAFWYNPALFGDPWMNAVNLTMAEIEASPPGAGHWISNFVAIVAQVYVLAWLMIRLNSDNILKGLLLGLLLSFTYYMLPVIRNGLFEQTPYYLAWINGGYIMAGLALSGIILGAWKKVV